LPRRARADTSPSKMRSTRTPRRESRDMNRSEIASPARTFFRAGWTERGAEPARWGLSATQASRATGMNARLAHGKRRDMQGDLDEFLSGGKQKLKRRADYTTRSSLRPSRSSC